MQLSDFRNEPFTDFSKPENKQAFEAALKKVEQDYLGRAWSCWIDGEEVSGKNTFEGHDPSARPQTMVEKRNQMSKHASKPSNGVLAVES